MLRRRYLRFLQAQPKKTQMITYDVSTTSKVANFRIFTEKATAWFKWFWIFFCWAVIVRTTSGWWYGFSLLCFCKYINTIEVGGILPKIRIAQRNDCFMEESFCNWTIWSFFLEEYWTDVKINSTKKFFSPTKPLSKQLYAFWSLYYPTYSVL